MAQYSDTMKRAVLRYHGYRLVQTNDEQTAAATARHFGLPEPTVRSWINGEGINDDVLMTAREERALAAAVARDRAMMTSTFMTPEKMEESKLADLVAAFKTLLAVADTQEGIASPDAVVLSGKKPEEIAALQASADAILEGAGIQVVDAEPTE